MCSEHTQSSIFHGGIRYLQLVKPEDAKSQNAEG